MNTNHLFHSQVQSNTEGQFGHYQYSLSLKPNPGDPDPSLIYFRTEDSSGYQIQEIDGYFLLGSLQKRKSNLDLWTISLMSPNGVSVSYDFIGYGTLWNKLLAKAWVSFEDFPTSYIGD